MFIDESGIDDNDSWPYGWSKKGSRVYDFKPAHKKRRFSMIASLNNKEIKAPIIFEGHTNKKFFELWVEKQLVPTLETGSTVIMDNAAFHKSTKVKEYIEKANCKLIFLPPYSPDLNLIENFWAKLKKYVRKIIKSLQYNLESALIHAFNVLVKL